MAQVRGSLPKSADITPYFLEEDNVSLFIPNRLQAEPAGNALHDVCRNRRVTFANHDCDWLVEKTLAI